MTILRISYEAAFRINKLLKLDDNSKDLIIMSN